jgi:hypothetical protein
MKIEEIQLNKIIRKLSRNNWTTEEIGAVMGVSWVAIELHRARMMSIFKGF